METAERVYLALQHAAVRMRGLDDELGLSVARFSALARLRYDGDATVGQLATAEHVAQPSMTQLVAGLERGGPRASASGSR